MCNVRFRQTCGQSTVYADEATSEANNFMQTSNALMKQAGARLQFSRCSRNSEKGVIAMRMLISRETTQNTFIPVDDRFPFRRLLVLTADRSESTKK